MELLARGVVLKKFVGWIVCVGIAAWIHEWVAIAVILLSAAILPWVWILRSRAGNATSSEAPPGASGRREPVHNPRPPRGTPVEPWSVGGVTRVNAVGESKYPEGLRGALADFRQPLTSQGVELSGARAVLATDPSNPYDNNAVGVWIEGRHLVGYLPAELAAQYAPALSQLEEEASNLRVPARVWIAERDGVFGSVSLSMPSPSGVLSFNELPEEPHCVMPPGKALQVTGEDGYMDVLRGYVHDNQRHLAVTLHVVSQPAATPRGQASEVVEVRLDGSRIGCLTKASSEAIRDVVTYVAERGRLPVARAVLKGSSIKADVTLYVARSSEVTQKWLDGIEDAQAPAT